MRFYVSWYPGDPWYPFYDDNCALLISVTSVSREWTLRQTSPLPRSLILDSGGYRYATSPTERPTPKVLLERQLHIIQNLYVPTLLCALDFPILDESLSERQKDQCIHQTIAYAYEFNSLMQQNSLPNHIEGLGIIQGYDVPSLVYCAHELKAIGFTRFGLGSLAALRHHKEIITRVQAAIDVVGTALHIFGIGAIQTLRALRDLGVDSVDSARPAKAAMYNQVFYNHPFRLYSIKESRDKTGMAMPDHRRISQPLPCNCPVCKGMSGSNILKIGRREYVWARTLHNYWHLKQTLIR